MKTMAGAVRLRVISLFALALAACLCCAASACSSGQVASSDAGEK